MKVNNIKLVSALEHMLEHQDLMGKSIHTMHVEAQRARACRNKVSLGHGIAARKKGHLMPLMNQFFSEI
jgi:hypothetical protein